MIAQMAKKLLIIDIHEVYVEGLLKVLQSDPNINAVSMFGTVAEVVQAVTENKPDIVLIDPQSFESTDIVSRMHQAAPSVQIIALTHSKKRLDMLSVMSGGATAYVSKETKSESLLRALHLASEGKMVIDQSMASLVINAFKFIYEHTHSIVGEEEVHLLSDQEKAIVALLSKGATNKDIGECLYVTENTVKGHIRNIMRKFGVHHRLELGLWGIKEDIVTTQPPCE